MFSWLSVVAIIVVVLRIFNLSVRDNLKQVEENSAERLTRSLLAVCFALTFYPLVRSFFLGQIQTWIDFLFAAVVLSWMTGRKALAGVATGLICLIKPQLSLLLLWGLLRKQQRFVAGMAATIGTFVILSLWRYGLADNLDYLNVLSFIGKHGESFYPNQSVNGLLNRMLFNGNNLVWDEKNLAPYNSHFGTLASSLLIVGAALFWRRKDQPGQLTDLLIATLSFTVASPIAWEHHYGEMLPMFAVALPATLSLGLAPRRIIWLAVSFFISSNYFQLTDRLAATHWNFLQSYLLFGAVLLLLHLYYLRHKQQELLTGWSREVPSTAGSRLAAECNWHTDRLSTLQR